MRTTVSINEELLQRARERARLEGVTLGTVVENALRRDLARSIQARVPVVPRFDAGTGPRPGIDLTSNRALQEALDDAREEAVARKEALGEGLDPAVDQVHRVDRLR